MNVFLYELNSLWILTLLTGLMIIAIEIGLRIGLRSQLTHSSDARQQINIIQTSLLGILALVLGFTFSIALDRYNSRSIAVVEEANAISTAYERATMAPDSIRQELQAGLQEYLDLRVQAGTIKLNRHSDWLDLLNQAENKYREIWALASSIDASDMQPVMLVSLLQSLNSVSDAQSRRIAEIERHVPQLFMLVLYGSFIIAGGVIGYTAGVANHRPAYVTYVMMMVIVLLMYMVIDLDQPRRGMIHVSQDSLLDLQTSLRN